MSRYDKHRTRSLSSLLQLGTQWPSSVESCSQQDTTSCASKNYLTLNLCSVSIPLEARCGPSLIAHRCSSLLSFVPQLSAEQLSSHESSHPQHLQLRSQFNNHATLGHSFYLKQLTLGSNNQCFLLQACVSFPSSTSRSSTIPDFFRPHSSGTNIKSIGCSPRMQCVLSIHLLFGTFRISWYRGLGICIPKNCS